MTDKRKPRRGRGGVSECVLARCRERSDDTNLHHLPQVSVTAEADPDRHGWHVRARRAGRLHYWRHSHALRSVANREAEQVATARRWAWWLA